LNNSKYFTFVADFEVINVSMYYYNGTHHIFIANLSKSTSQPGVFEYLWTSIQANTSTITGDMINLSIRLEDIFGNYNNYSYNFTADYTNPTLNIQIGDGSQNYESDIIADPLTPINFISNEEVVNYYQITDNITGESADWIQFNSSHIDKIGDLGNLPDIFIINYRGIDLAGNIANTSTYNTGLKYIRFSRRTSMTWVNNSIDLNSIYAWNRTLVFENNGQFGNQLQLDILINGLNYGTAILEDGYYKVKFGTENSRETLLTYSDSLISPYISSNINPLSHLSWIVNETEYFGAVKHVLLDGDITFLNPLTSGNSYSFNISELYSKTIILPNFLRNKYIYYYNDTQDNSSQIIYLSYTDYYINETGYITFPEGSILHELFANQSQIVNGTIFIEYTMSDMARQLNLLNSEGFVIDLLIPATFYEHTTIEKLTVMFNTYLGDSFAKVFYDLDLREFFMEDVRDKYEEDVFGLGKMMNISLFISFQELIFSNPNVMFNPQDIDFIEIIASDSQKWPGSFIKEYDQYTVLDLPYQRVAVRNIRLYNLISDITQEDEQGFVNSLIEIRAPNYHDFYATSQMKIKRVNIRLSDIEFYNNRAPIITTTTAEYSDYIEAYMRNDFGSNPIVLNDILQIPIYLINASSGELHTISNLYWITKNDLATPYTYPNNYYFSRFEVPKALGIHTLTLGSDGSPLHKMIFDSLPTFTLTVEQERISSAEPIYIEEDFYELEYEKPLIIKGAVRDNDHYLVEDEVYQYKVEESLDGSTVHQLNVIAPLNDANYISKTQFAIYYINEKLEKIPLYDNLGNSEFVNTTLLSSRPQITYIDNAYLLYIYWNISDIETNFITVDTNLLISYKVIKGRSISPVSISSIDQFGHDEEQHLVEIPFAQYDMVNNNWITQGEFSEPFIIDKELLLTEVNQSSVWISGPEYQDGPITHSHKIVEFDSLYVRKNGTINFIPVNNNNYSVLITEDGYLQVTYHNYQSGDTLIIGYYSYRPIILTHPVSTLEYIKITSRDNSSYSKIFDSTEFTISEDNYHIHFYNLYKSVLLSGFTLYDSFEVKYQGSLAKRVDLAKSVLILQEDAGGNFVPVDIIEIDNVGMFNYERTFSASGLSLPIGGERIVNMKLTYLPLKVFNKAINNNVSISYSYYSGGVPYSRYVYEASDQWVKPFRIMTVPKKVKLQMVEDIKQNMVVSQKFIENREYQFNYNPLETLEKDNEYLALQIDALTKEDYSFTYKIVDYADNPISDVILWAQIGFVPKSETKFQNEMAVINDNIPIYYESLGTTPITSEGPGQGPNKMFGAPLTYGTWSSDSYGPYLWSWKSTNEFGEATWEISLDNDYLQDFAKIFGSIEGIYSVEDTVLFIRVVASMFNWDNMKITNPEQLLCSRDGNVFDGTNIDTSYDFTNLMFLDPTYATGIVRLHKKDTALAVGNYLTYDLPDPENPVYNDLMINLYATEATPIPNSVSHTLESLTRVYDVNELEPQAESILSDDHAYYVSVEIYNPQNEPVENFRQKIEPTIDGGTITIDDYTMQNILDRLGPGLSTIKIQLLESDYYKASPVVTVPLEIRPPNWVKFGQKNTQIPLINPFISAWGSVFDDENPAVFESNYPHLIGSVWVKSDFNATEERSIQDYVEITATFITDDGDSFPLRENVMLRPGNREGIMKFDLGFGPEDLWLMGLSGNLNLSFDISYNEADIYREGRDVTIYLLDLRLEQNPSSDNPTVIWSLYNHGFTSSEVNIARNSAVDINWGSTLTLGQNYLNWTYGAKISHVYRSGQNQYGIDPTSDIFSIVGLSSIAGLVILAKKNGVEVKFIPGINCSMLTGDLQTQSIVVFTGDTPDPDTEFKIIYQLSFNNYNYGEITLGAFNNLNTGWINWYLPSGFLPPSEENREPLTINQSITGYELGYGFQKIKKPYNNSVRLIYNTQDYEQFNAAKINDPALYIGLDNSSAETILELYQIPLLYAPEVNMSFLLDPIIVDYINTSRNYNDLVIKVFVVVSDEFNSYFTETITVPLDKASILGKLDSDGYYKIHYNKDLQSIYDAYGENSIDIYISIAQPGDSQNYIPYVIMEQFTYLCDEYIVEMYDRMPRTRKGALNVKSAVNTPHYFQIFTKPLIDDPFYLLNNSYITITEDLPYSSLVSLDTGTGEEYSFNYLGNQETLPVNKENFYMIKNLGLFTDAYNLDEPVYQSGYLDLHYGSGTSIRGERDYDKRIYMVFNDTYPPILGGDYSSFVDINGRATSWVNTFELSNKFLTTNEIKVAGTVFYHQLIDLVNGPIVNKVDINNLFGDRDFESKIPEFGIRLPDNLSIANIRAIGKPYNFQLSIQGFPKGDCETYGKIPIPGALVKFSPSSIVLDPISDFSLEYTNNGSKYIVFFKNDTYVKNYFSTNGKIMLDYWVYQQFLQGFDYEIIESPIDPFTSLIQWKYIINDINDFSMHPDFSQSASFTVSFSALEWDYLKSFYIKQITDDITFQPKVRTNITVEYTGDDVETFSILNVVPDDQQFKGTELFTNIYLIIWDDTNPFSVHTHKVQVYPAQQFLQKEQGSDIYYTLNFSKISLPIDNEIMQNTYVFIEVEFNSTQLIYPLSATPFNYEYISKDLDDYHITLNIGGIEYISNADKNSPLINFHDFVEKIEANKIYFYKRQSNDPSYIKPGTPMVVSYRHKIQPGLIERKRFTMVVYPWTNMFDTLLSDVALETSSDSLITYRERYRKLSGGSVLSAFEYGLSINETYTLYMSYRLNQREGFEEKYSIHYTNDRIDYGGSYAYEFDLMPYNIDKYASILIEGGEPAVSVYFFDKSGKMRFLEDKHFIVNLTANKIILLPEFHGSIDFNLITNSDEVIGYDIREFYVSIISNNSDIEYQSHMFSYNPSRPIEKTLNVNNWNVTTKTGVSVFPNLNTFYFIDEVRSTYTNFACFASQIGTYLQNGDKLVFDILKEINSSNPDLMNDIHTGKILSLFIDTNIKNYESLEKIIINLYSPVGLISTQIISAEELISYDFALKIDLPSGPNNLQKIEFIPQFKNAEQYSISNTVGIPQFEVIEWNEQMAYYASNGLKYMNITLEEKLFINPSNVIYLFNTQLDHLALPAGVSISYSANKDQFGNIEGYSIRIPSQYLNPQNTSQILTFKEGDQILVKYNSPVEKAINVGIGKLYFQRIPYGFNPTLPEAEVLLINTDDTEDYSQFLNPYHLQIPLELTPFNTEMSNDVISAKIPLNLATLTPFATNGIVDFTNILISVPYYNYELTLKDILIQKEGQGTSVEFESVNERVWQYSEMEDYTSSDAPMNDSYPFAQPSNIFGGANWLNYLKISDENFNFFSVNTTGDQDQLLWNSTHFSWNPAFDRFQEYWNTQIELPSTTDSNTELYIEYCTDNSWQTPIRLDYPNIDFGSIEAIYNYNHYLNPQYEKFNDQIITNSIYDYKMVQYYQESFRVYANISSYTYYFQLEESLEKDFVNLALFQVIGLNATFGETEINNDNINYRIKFNITAKTITITDLNPADGNLNQFDLIMVMFNFTAGPISSSTEIILSSEFYNKYLSNPEDTFHNIISVNFQYSQASGDILFNEDSQIITSDTTSFIPIDFSRNSVINPSQRVIGYGSTLFDNFELYEDPFNQILEADLDGDHQKDYKHMIDLNKDGNWDVIRYGVDDPENFGELIWHTIIEDYQSQETTVDRNAEGVKRTKWFDIEDTEFASYSPNLLDIFELEHWWEIFIIVPVIIENIARIWIPDTDFWAQKSIRQQTTRTEYKKSEYYSVKIDEERNGYLDKQVIYEKNDIVVYQEAITYDTTILAGKPQSFWTKVWKNTVTFFLGPQEDDVFNDNNLNEAKLDSAQYNGAIPSSYKKFTKTTTTNYRDEYISEAIIIHDWSEGEIVSTRAYSDEFKDSMVLSESTEKIITNLLTDQQINYNTIPELASANPSNTSWGVATWGQDKIPTKFDTKTTFIGGQETRENIYTQTVKIIIPNRYSVYHDHLKADPNLRTTQGDTNITITGVFITPPDGKVYYTMDKDLFKLGLGKITGHYLYHDSDNNGFYETVYILQPSHTVENGISVYRVVSIGYNDDGKHEFTPYENIGVLPVSVSDFNTVTALPGQYSKWKYHFGQLINNELLFPKELYDGYEMRDQIFEAAKLTRNSITVLGYQNPELFHEIKHHYYKEVWNSYREEMGEDVAEQVLMTFVASMVSITVQALVMAAFAPINIITWGATIPLSLKISHIAGTLAYLGVYTILTKYFMDIDAQEERAKERAAMYYPEGIYNREPVKISEKLWSDRVLGDSMPAALTGHTGAYYTVIEGGRTGRMYSSYAIVSPPNAGRIWNSIGSFAAYFGATLVKMGSEILDLFFNPAAFMEEGTDPDFLYGLSFDYLNLDYMLVSSELYGYRELAYYDYGTEFSWLEVLYDWYRANTLGYLQHRIKRETTKEEAEVSKLYEEDPLILDTIKPIWVQTKFGLEPQYKFVDSNSEMNHLTLPKSHLYQPIVLDPIRYDQLNPVKGNLFVEIKCSSSVGSRGLKPVLSEIEKQSYSAKVNLSNHAFEYPITNVSIEVWQLGFLGLPYYQGEVIVDLFKQDVESGNLYFFQTFEQIILSKDAVLYSKLSENNVFYKVHVVFDRFVRDDGLEQHAQWKLAQATSYVIMETMNQFTFAKTAAEMTASVGYTEVMTIVSTAISAPAVALGSYAVSGLSKWLMQSSLKSVLAGIAKSIFTESIKEALEEIVIDGLIETLSENLVEMAGGSDQLAYWISTLATSARETGTDLAKSVRGKTQTNPIQIEYGKAIAKQIRRGGEIDSKFKKDTRKQLTAQFTEFDKALQEQNKQEKEKERRKKFMSGFFKLVSFVMPALYFTGKSATFNYKLVKKFTKTDPKVKGMSLSKEWAIAKQIFKATKEGRITTEDLKAIDQSQMFDKPALDTHIGNLLFKAKTGKDITSVPMTPSILQDRSLLKQFLKSESEKKALKLIEEKFKDIKNSFDEAEGLKINYKVLDNIDTSTRVPVKYTGVEPSSAKEEPSTGDPVYYWDEESRTQLVPETPDDMTLGQALEIRGREMGMDPERRKVFKILGQIVAPGLWVDTTEGKKLLKSSLKYKKFLLEKLGYNENRLKEIIKSGSQEWVTDDQLRIEILYFDEAFEGIRELQETYPELHNFLFEMNYLTGNNLQAIALQEGNLHILNEFFENIFTPIRDAFIDKHRTLLGLRTSTDTPSRIWVQMNLRNIVKNTWLSEDRLNRIPHEHQQSYKDLVWKIFDFKFVETLSNTYPNQLRDIMTNNINRLVFDYLMRTFITKDDKSFKLNDLIPNIRQIIALISDGSIDLKSLESEMRSPGARILFFKLLAESFQPFTEQGYMTDVTNNPLRATTFFGWESETSYFFDIYPDRVIKAFKESNYDFRAMYQFMEQNPEYLNRLPNRAFNEDVLHQQFAQIRKLINNGIDTTRYVNLPKNGREFDMLVLILSGKIHSTHIKTYMETFTGIDDKISDKRILLRRDYMGTLYADSEYHFSTKDFKNQKKVQGFDHDADLAMPGYGLASTSDNQQNARITANGILAMKSIMFKSRVLSGLMDKGPLDLMVYYGITEILNDYTKDATFKSIEE
jgi:hypothetical protein